MTQNTNAILIRQLQGQLSRIVDTSTQVSDTELDEQFITVYSGKASLMTRSLEELLRVRPYPQDKPLGTSYTYQEILEECGQCLRNDTFADRFSAFAKRRGWPCSFSPTVVRSQFDEIDLRRTLLMIDLHFCSGVASYYAIQVLKDQDGAWKQVCGWLARAHGHVLQQGASPAGPTLEGIQGQGLNESHIITQSLSWLADGVDHFAKSLEALEQVSWWLNGQRHSNTIRVRHIPIVTVRPTAEKRMQLVPLLGELKLEFLAGSGTGLIESPTMWNCPRTKQFNRTLEEAYVAAWPDPTKRPAVRWSALLPDADPLLPLDGLSHGLAACVGMRVLRDKLKYDEDCIFSARAEGDRIGNVSELRTKWDGIKSSTRQFRSFGIPSDATDFDEDELQDRREGRVWIEKIKTIDDAVKLATRTETGVRKFLRAIKDHPDIGPRLHYLPHKPSELFVAPDVFDIPLQDELDDRIRKKDTNQQGDPRQTWFQDPSLTVRALDVNELDLDYETYHLGRRTWREVLSGLAAQPTARAIILGPPGQGKSFLADMTASTIAKQALDQLDDPELNVELDDVPLPICIALQNVIKTMSTARHTKGEPVLDAIVASVQHKYEMVSTATELYLRQHFRNERVWVFFDGLDEVDASNTDLQTVMQFAQSLSGKLLVSGRPYGIADHYRTLVTNLFGLDVALNQLPDEIRAYKLAPFNDDQIHQFTALWFAGSEQLPPTFVNLFQSCSSVRHLACVPFLLSLLCAVASDQNNSIPINTTRGELYELFFEKLFRLKEKHRWLEWRNFLPVLAVQMLSNSVHSPHIKGEAELREWLSNPDTTICGRPIPLGGEELVIDRWITKLSDELQDHGQGRKLRLIIPDDTGRLIFQHRSLVEFLVARYLSRQLSQNWLRNGWKEQIQLGRETWVLADLLDHKAWDPAWHEIIYFLAGMLHHPGRLLSMFTESSEDDDARHRLSLAGRCLAALSPRQRHRAQREVNLITTTTLSQWWVGFSKRIEEAVPELRKALPALALANGRVHVPTMKRIVKTRAFAQQLREMWLLIFIYGAMALCLAKACLHGTHAGAAVGNVPFVCGTVFLLTLYILKTGFVRHPFIMHARLYTKALCAFVNQMWHNVYGLFRNDDEYQCVKDFLVHMLRDKRNEHNCLMALLCIYRMGVAVATPQIIDALGELLSLKESRFRVFSIRALVVLGTLSVRRDIMEKLLELSSDDEEEIQDIAIYAFGCLYKLSKSLPSLINSLPDNLADRMVEMHRARDENKDAATRLFVSTEMGHELAVPKMIEFVESQFSGTDEMQIHFALGLLAMIGSEGFTESIVNHHFVLLKSSSSKLRRDLVRSLGRARICRQAIVSELAALLVDVDSENKILACQSIAKIGAEAATPVVLRVICDLLSDQMPSVRLSAAQTIPHLRRVSEAILDRICGLLHDRHPDVQAAAVIALDQLGRIAVTPAILNELGRLQFNRFDDGNWSLIPSLCRALGPFTVDSWDDPKRRRMSEKWLVNMPTLLRLSENQDQRECMAEAIGILESFGFRFFTTPGIAVRVFLIGDLSRVSKTSSPSQEMSP